MAIIRLNKFIAYAGVASRRRADTLISSGHVLVNGKRVTTLGTMIDSVADVVVVGGKTVQPVTTMRYIAVHKPVGYISTRATHPKEKTVYDLVPESRDLVIAGRLDKDSDGLVLLTNDGELVNLLTHPRYGHQKEYEIVTTRPFSVEDIRQLMNGILLDEGKARFDTLIAVAANRYRVTMHQGWKRQIRRMTAAVHAHIERLTRVRIQSLELGNLPPGQWREVQKSDIV
ncbi:MAG: rRNA pseudouridine synthase [Candidatus Kerfeldbacteria bacterium]|nr:rRNA pseudouridine synthase [Candidatus Kerfeldbacteria bacterium]